MIKKIFFTTLGVIINSIIISSFVKNIMSIINNKNNNKKEINLYVLGNDPTNLEQFTQITYNLSEIRKLGVDISLTRTEEEAIFSEMDASLMELQDFLCDSQAGGIPNPSILTKMYLENCSVKVLDLRVLLEKLKGKDITNKYSEESNILKIIPLDNNDANKTS